MQRFANSPLQSSMLTITQKILRLVLLGVFALATANTALAQSISYGVSSLNFGAVPINGSSAQKEITVTNDGAVSLTVNSQTFTNGNASYSIGSTTCMSTLGVGQSCSFKVQLSPTTLGAKTDIVRLLTTPATSNPGVTLSATATQSCQFIPTTGLWNVAANWANCTGGDGTVANTPGPSNRAEVTGGKTVELASGATTVGDVYLGASVLLGNMDNSSQLNITRAGGISWSSADNTFERIQVSIVDSVGTVNIVGKLTLNNATLRNEFSSLTTNSILFFDQGPGNPALEINNNGAFINNSHVVLDGGILLLSGGSMTSNSPGEIFLGNSITITTNGNTFTNNALFSLLSPHVLTIVGASSIVTGAQSIFSGTGTVTATAQTLNIAGGTVGQDLTFNVGTLKLAGGRLIVNATSVFTVNGNLIVGTDSDLYFNISAPSVFSIINVVGDVTFNAPPVSAELTFKNNNPPVPAQLTFNTISPYAPTIGTQFNVLTYTGTLTGTASAIDSIGAVVYDADYATPGVIKAVVAPPLTSIAPTTHAYPSTLYGNFASQTFTITNNSGSASTLGNTTTQFTGADPFDFAVFSDTCTGIVADGATCTIVIHFLPTTHPVGTKSANFEITINSDTVSAALTGTTLSPAGGWLVGLGGTTEIPGPTPVGSTSSAIVTLYNVGSAPVNVTGIASAPPLTSNFSGCTTPVAAGASCQVTISATLAGVGSLAGTYVVATTNPANNPELFASAEGTNTLAPTVSTAVVPATILLGGTTTATLTITNPNPSATLNDISVTSILTFGQLAVAPTPNASSTCSVAEISAFGGASSASIGGISLAPSGSCTFSYDLKSVNTTGTWAVGTNSVSSDEASADIVGGSVSVLVASALPPPSPTTLSFGNVSSNTFSAFQFVTITNPNANAVAVSSVTTGSPNFFLQTPPLTCATSIPANGACTYSVRYQAPGSLTTQMATLAVVTGLGTVSVPLTATSTAFNVTTTPSMQNFASVALGQQSAITQFTVTNNGIGSANIDSTTLSGPDLSDFVLVGTTCAGNFAPSATCTADVRFAPTSSVGPKSASLRLQHGNLANTSALSGTATAASLAPTITSAAPAGTGTIGMPYSHAYTATGTPATMTWSVIAGVLPGGLSLDSMTGILTGTPNTVGTFNFTVQANNTIAPAATQPATITVVNALIVTNINDSGAGSLRDAITFLNTNCTATPTIAFNIPGGGPHKIQPASPLPNIVCKDTTIDGYTQPGAAVNTAGAGITNAVIKIWLDGALQTGGQGLHFPYNGSQANTGAGIVRGLSITRFDVGVKADYAARIRGNFIGIEPDGVTAGKNAVGVAASSSSVLGPCCVKVGGATVADTNLIAALVSGVAVDHISAEIERNLFGYDRNGNPLAALGGLQAINSTPGGTSFGTQNLLVSNNRIAHQNRMLLSGSAEVQLVQNRARSIATEVANLGAPQIELTAVEFNATANTTRLDGNMTSTGANTYNIDIYRNPSGTVTPPQLESYYNSFTQSPGMAGTIPFSVNRPAILDNLSLLLTNQSNMPNPRSYSVLGYKRPFVAAALASSFNATAGGAAVNQTLMFTNTFGGNITFGATPGVVTGTGYAVTGGTCANATIANGNQCSVIVSYSSATVTSNVPGTLTVSVSVPNQPGMLGGVVTVTTNYVESLTASATAAPPTTLTLSASMLNFGNITVSQSAMNQQIIVTNTGTSPLLVTSITLSGVSQSDYSINNNCTSNAIAPAPAPNTCTITLGFTAQGLGSRVAQANITSNATGSPHIVTLGGTGLAAALIALPTSLTFPSTLVGSQSAIQNVTMTNNTGAAGGLMLSLPTHIQYVTDNCGGFAIGASCTFQFRLLPTAAGMLTGTIMLTANSQTANISFTGTGVAVGVAASSTTVNFGTSGVGVAAVAQMVTLTNNTAASITFTAGTVGGTNAADFSVNVSNCTMAPVLPTGTCTITLNFTPAAIGSRSATYSVASSATVNPLISLGGIGGPAGTAPTITSSAPPAGLTNVAYSFTPSATGTAPITWLIATGSLPPGLGINATTGAITGTPTTAGVFTFTLRATNTAGQANLLTSITINVPIIAEISVSPARLSFGNQNIGTTSAPQTVTVSNSGNGPFNITSITGIGDFGFISTCPSTLASGTSCTINFTFSPLIAGPLTGLVSVNSTALRGSGSITLDGTGIAVPRANIIINPASLTFGDQAVGTASPAQIIFISNTGLATLELRNIALNSGSASSTTATFIRTDPPMADNPRNHPSCGGTLAPGLSCALGISFSPAAIGNQTASIDITHNSTPTGAQGNSSISLNGNGTPRREAIIRVTGNTAFGDQVLGTTSAAQALTVTNTGTINLNVGSVSITPTSAATNANDFQAASACGTLTPNATCTINVTFAPTGDISAIGAKAATLNIASNAVNTSAGTANLTGNALAVPRPIVRLSATNIGFGTSIISGAALSERITLTNIGGLPLVISAASLSGESSDYALVDECRTALNTNQSCTITVIFSPLRLGSREASLTITSNANPSTNTVPLTGIGCRYLSPAAQRLFSTSCGGQ